MLGQVAEELQADPGCGRWPEEARQGQAGLGKQATPLCSPVLPLPHGVTSASMRGALDSCLVLIMCHIWEAEGWTCMSGTHGQQVSLCNLLAV